MLEEYTRIANNIEDFRKQTNAYFVNMQNNLRTLHKTECPLCQYSSYAFRFIPFASLEEVALFESSHNDMTPFRKCGNCFRKKK